MEFFTQIKIKPFDKRISHSQQILSIGSCFAENIAQRLRSAKFHVTSSPTGILFNPESIADCIDALSQKRVIAEEELQQANGVWFDFDFHSSFSSTDRNTAVSTMQSAINQGGEALKNSEVVIITFGSAWVYRHKATDKVVANCHKQPQSIFQRELLSTHQIVERWSKLLESTLRGKQVIFTVSPIRHLSDGLEQNSLSKSILRVAIAELVERFDNASYFPSFEIMNDVLRDYRFYAEDMLHPSSVAVEYIWQRFSEVAFSQPTLELIESIAKISQAAAHRPFNPTSATYHDFCRKQLAEIEKINDCQPTIDFSEEKAIFLVHL